MKDGLLIYIRSCFALQSGALLFSGLFTFRINLSLRTYVRNLFFEYVHSFCYVICEKNFYTEIALKTAQFLFKMKNFAFFFKKR